MAEEGEEFDYSPGLGAVESEAAKVAVREVV
jgi:hypothetical protein